MLEEHDTCLRFITYKPLGFKLKYSFDFKANRREDGTDEVDDDGSGLGGICEHHHETERNW